jgi:sporulation protein YlmC with PRC-barrel domain
MLKKLMITTAAGALMVTAGWAQAPNQSSQPSSSAPAASQQQGSPSGSASFVTTQRPDQWLASKFKGTDVVGADDQKVGDVSDILFDKSGKIDAFVVSVGGFLGIGAKDVALPPSAFQVVADDRRGATTGTGANSARANDPNDIKLKVAMTKDELKNAPAFEHYRAPSATGSANRPAGGGMGGGTGGGAGGGAGR